MLKSLGNFLCVSFVYLAQRRDPRYMVDTLWEYHGRGEGEGGYVHVIINVFGVSFICVTCIIVRHMC
jgi:hypothetical protein